MEVDRKQQNKIKFICIIFKITPDLLGGCDEISSYPPKLAHSNFHKKKNQLKF